MQKWSAVVPNADPERNVINTDMQQGGSFPSPSSGVEKAKGNLSLAVEENSRCAMIVSLLLAGCRHTALTRRLLAQLLDQKPSIRESHANCLVCVVKET